MLGSIEKDHNCGERTHPRLRSNAKNIIIFRLRYGRNSLLCPCQWCSSHDTSSVNTEIRHEMSIIQGNDDVSSLAVTTQHLPRGGFIGELDDEIIWEAKRFLVIDKTLHIRSITPWQSHRTSKKYAGHIGSRTRRTGDKALPILPTHSILVLSGMTTKLCRDISSP